MWRNGARMGPVVRVGRDLEGSLGGVSMWPQVDEPAPSLWPPLVVLGLLVVVAVVGIMLR